VAPSGMRPPQAAVAVIFFTTRLAAGLSGSKTGALSELAQLADVSPANPFAVCSSRAKLLSPPACSEPWQLPPPHLPLRIANPSQPVSVDPPPPAPAATLPLPASPAIVLPPVPGFADEPPPPPFAVPPPLPLAAVPPPAPPADATGPPEAYLSAIRCSSSSSRAGVSPPAHAATKPRVTPRLHKPNVRIALSCIIFLPWPRLSWRDGNMRRSACNFARAGWEARGPRRGGYLSQSSEPVNEV